MSVRPPSDITPSRFFEEWLPAQVKVDALPGSPMTIRVDLAGDDGGTWDLKVGGGSGLHAARSEGGDADVTVKQTVADWKAIAVGEPGAVTLAPPQASPTDILFLDRQAQQMVKSVKGTVRFEVTGYNGRTWMLTVRFGAGPVGDAADATISVDAETYAGMLARTIPPPQAYFSGKVRLSGDMNLAMQLGMAMMPRFS